MKTWLEPPRLRIGPETEEEHRHATWLELFYDLVFVVAISQIAHYLHEDITWSRFFGFVFLFVPIWWSWVGTTFYANRFDTDDIGNRLLTGFHMLAIAGLAVNVHDGLSESSAGFALAYAISRFILVFQYLRVLKYIPQARGLATHYAIGFAMAATLWLISVFIPTPLRFILWGLSLSVDFATPLTAKRHQANLLPHPEHLPERFGLFTIIVLGEAIMAVVNGVSEKHWDIGSAIAAVLGFLVAFGLWWIYFENVAGSALINAGKQRKLGIFQVWLFGHLPLVIGLTATGVGVQGVVLSDASLALPTPQRWLICGAVALCLLGLGILHNTGLIFPCKVRARYRLGAATILLIIAVAGIKFTPVIVIGSVALVLLSQVVQDLYQSGQFSS